MVIGKSTETIIEKRYIYKCHVQQGNCPVKDYGYSHTCIKPIPTPNQTFVGYCYNCGGDGHSQNYCPLKFCTLCNGYGHSERVCNKS
jgi:hypothetical protein